MAKAKTPHSVWRTATEWMFSAFPLNHRAAYDFAVWVQWRDGNRVCIRRNRDGPGRVWSRSEGDWVWEPIPGERSEEFIADTRFDLETAFALAEQAARSVTVNGQTADDARRQRWARWGR